MKLFTTKREFNRQTLAKTLRIAAFSFVFGISACVRTTYTDSYLTVSDDGRIHVRSESRGSLTTTNADYVTAPTIMASMPKYVKLARPVNGLFIGISNFDGSGPITTPAHTIGASIMQNLFELAADRSSFPPSRNNEGSDKTGRSRFQFLGDLRLDPLDPNWSSREVTKLLKGIDQRAVYEYSDVYSLKKGELWPIIQGPSLTKSYVLQSIRTHAEQLRKQNPLDRTIGVFYIATHGFLGPNGERYAFAADSNKSQISSMLSYEEIVSVYSEALGNDLPTKIVIIFDTCLFTEENEGVAPPMPLSVPLSAIAISSAAPGQYSAYWTQTAGLKLNELTWGVGPFRRTIKNKDLSYFQTISAVPIGLTWALSEIERACTGNDRSFTREITSRELGIITKESIPFVAEKSKLDITKAQTAEFFLSSTYDLLDSYWEMVLTPEQVQAMRNSEAIFLTNCKNG